MRFQPRDDHLKLVEILPIESLDDFATDLHSYLTADGEKNRALVYLHGYNTSFADASVRAAQIATDLNVSGVTAFFSWPSHAMSAMYPADSQRAAASEAHLMDFLQAVSERAEVERIDVIAHSMGNQVFARIVQSLLADAKFNGIHLGTVILAAPDIDAVLFRQIANAYSQTSKDVTMYVSGKDHALDISGALQAGQRAGRIPPVTVVPGIDTIDVSDIDLSLLGHGYFAAAGPVLYDMKLLLEGTTDPGSRIRLNSVNDAVDGASYWCLYP